MTFVIVLACGHDESVRACVRMRSVRARVHRIWGVEEGRQGGGVYYKTLPHLHPAVYMRDSDISVTRARVPLNSARAHARTSLINARITFNNPENVEFCPPRAENGYDSEKRSLPPSPHPPAKEIKTRYR